jgi:Uma2 family endonuclease
MYAPSAHGLPPRPPGGYTSDDLPPGSPYELSEGRLIECSPAGRRHQDSATATSKVLELDPAAEHVVLDVGFKLGPRTMRAPDVAVGGALATQPNQEGYVQGAPLLAVEHADRGQDEEDLKVKIRELLAAGTKYVWVVYLNGIQRVEVYEREQPRRTYNLDDTLTAPGVLQNPVPVRALFDRKFAEELVLQSGMRRGKASAILTLLAARQISLTAEQQDRVMHCADDTQIDRWLLAAVTAESAAELGL